MDTNMVNYKMIGQRIKEARAKLGWQQSELADFDVAELQAFLEIIRSTKAVIRKTRKADY